MNNSMFLDLAFDVNLSIKDRIQNAKQADLNGYIPDDLFSFIKTQLHSSEQLFFAKYPVTNLQYSRFMNSDCNNKNYWQDFPMYDENNKFMNKTFKDEPLKWKHEITQRLKSDKLFPIYWNNKNLDNEQIEFSNKYNCTPVVGVHWFEAMAYCNWLLENWEECEESKNYKKPKEIRLPLREEWLYAAGESRMDSISNNIELINDRYPWSQGYYKEDDFIGKVNINSDSTSPVWMFPQSKSYPYNIYDLIGNIWEWQLNIYSKHNGDYQTMFGLCGGSWKYSHNALKTKCSYTNLTEEYDNQYGFRIVLVY
jgi:formylglycine-generating enzyme required for sulfatase activity